jgi:hypothetical protein
MDRVFDRVGLPSNGGYPGVVRATPLRRWSDDGRTVPQRASQADGASEPIPPEMLLSRQKATNGWYLPDSKF